MDIRNSLEGLRTLLGVNAPTTGEIQKKGADPSSNSEGVMTDRTTFSSVASEMSGAAAGEGVRTDKIAAVQGALAAGTYSVPAAAVASKLVDAMLGGQ